MLESHNEKELTRAEALKKAEAWKTLNTVLVQSNSKFMESLRSMLSEKTLRQEELKSILEKNKGTEDDNAEYIFLGGYIQALKDILDAGSNVQ